MNRGDLAATTSLRHVKTTAFLPPRRLLIREEESKSAADAMVNNKIAEPENGYVLSDHEIMINSTMSEESDVDAIPQCDKLPLVGGRHFFRNRLRVVDQDLSNICGPKVMIIGSMKCGTNKLAELLIKHPRIKVNSCNLSNTQGGCDQGLFQAALKQGFIFEGNDFTHIRRNDPDNWLMRK